MRNLVIVLRVLAVIFVLLSLAWNVWLLRTPEPTEGIQITGNGVLESK